MHAGAKGEIFAWLVAAKVEAAGVLINAGVVIGGAFDEDDGHAFLQFQPSEIEVLGGVAQGGPADRVGAEGFREGVSQ